MRCIGLSKFGAPVTDQLSKSNREKIAAHKTHSKHIVEQNISLPLKHKALFPVKGPTTRIIDQNTIKF